MTSIIILPVMKVIGAAIPNLFDNLKENQANRCIPESKPSLHAGNGANKCFNSHPIGQEVEP
jgi:hypothetical protein